MGLNVICLAKQTFATEAKIALTPAGGISRDGVKMIINPYDEFGIEEALLQKEKGTVGNVTVLAFGGADCLETVRKALAFGADDAIVVDPGDVPAEEIDASVRAAALAAAARGRGFDLIFCGKVAVDSNAGEVPGRLAELLGVPLVHVVGRVEIANGEVVAHREADGGTEVVEATLPAIVSADKSLNRPRYPTLPNIMKAKKKPLETLQLGALLADRPAATRRTVAYSLPPEKGPVKMVEGSAAEAAVTLARLLRDEAKVIK
jgi:electron transfer flavoprotein beta subunit